MEFEIDPTRAARNLKKHKVSVEEAASVFGDSMAYTFADPDHSVGEERWFIRHVPDGATSRSDLYSPQAEISHHQCASCEKA